MSEIGVAPRVLLVEDEILISEMVAEVLAEHGYEVHVAANAKDALRHLTCGAPCDVLFTDINLPGGVDGAALAQLARKLRPDLPVVYASGQVTAIEQFDVGQLTLHGVVWKTNRPRALVADPSGQVYVVREGDAIGTNEGSVVRIDDNLMLVRETYVDAMGEQTTKETEMRVRRNQEG